MNPSKEPNCDPNDLMLDRLDTIAAIMAASAQGHFKRTYTAADIASPSPLGFFALSITIAVQSLIYTGKLGATGQGFMIIIGLCICGVVLLLCGILEYCRRNTLLATLFILYAALFATLSIYTILLLDNIFTIPFQAMGKTVQTLLAIVGIITVVMAAIASQIALSLFVLLVFLALFLFMAAAFQTNLSETLIRATGWIGFITAFFSFYVAVGQMGEEVLGREIVPMFYAKAAMLHAGLLYPRLSQGDRRSISMGVPYEGRYEIKKGDALAALHQLPLVSHASKGKAAEHQV